MSAWITPTVGRVVWFRPASNAASAGFAPTACCAAIIAHVHSDSLINIAAFDCNGTAHAFTSVPLVQDGEAKPENGYYAEWMPYQKGQAAKAEKLAADSTTA